MMNPYLAFATGLFLGAAISSAIYAAKFRKLARGFIAMRDEVDHLRGALQSDARP